jgi:hypothetical protein
MLRGYHQAHHIDQLGPLVLMQFLSAWRWCRALG